MATATTDHAVEAHDDHEHHPTARTYWITFLLLAVLTAIEVAWSYLGLEGLALVAPLLIMMVLKFMIVGGVFMHLQTDFKVLNGYWFTLAFGIAVVLAVCVYLVVFAAFNFNI
ncbi:MAG: cytochrome C oxidase subunit IV family protein [Acidimicrobiales bacterium]|nr:cytochrome C oxidase subunit IV family protein [Acidimicrobiales bacterium]